MQNFKFHKKIIRIGEKLINCNRNCDGINNKERDNGIIPRCLIYEEEDREGDNGSILIGINPTKSREEEKTFYLRNGITYENVFKYWKDHNNTRYYKDIRNLLNSIGLNGPILWTELVKCENLGSKLPPLQTFRFCSNEFLKKELEFMPPSWPIIALGKFTYNAVSFLFPERNTIGVPHPTGSFGHFSKLFKNSKEKAEGLKEGVKGECEFIWNSSNHQTKWISG